VTPATTWTLDNWGEYLLACSNADGKIYEWDLNIANDGVALTNAPVSNKAVLVTAERFVFALGAGGNARKVAWSDQEDNTTWTPASNNQAGCRITAARAVQSRAANWGHSVSSSRASAPLAA
jgi:hypothetical protein